MRTVGRVLALFVAALIIQSTVSQSTTSRLIAQSLDRQSDNSPFFPVGVWYGGGTARAPMLVRDPAPERDRWRRDLQTIKSLGFNHVKTWVDWGSAEPVRGQYHFEALDQLVEGLNEIIGN